MVEFLISVLVISLIGAGLAAVLVFSERYVVNYGPCEIDINQGKKTLTMEGGQSLLNGLTQEKIFIPSACGGRGTCGFCKAKVLQGAGPLLPTETPFLSATEQKDNMRLTCQVKIRHDMAIQIPEALFSVRQFETVCSEIEDLTYDTKRFRFALQDPGEIRFVPGQYMQLRCPRYKGNREEVSRAYSIASDPAEQGIIDLIIRKVPDGICTTYCFKHLKVNDKVSLNGPFGDFRLTDTEAPMVFIAGASGMAPFVSILHWMKNNKSARTATYFFGGNLTKDLFMQDLMQGFEKALPNFKFIPVVAKPQECPDWQGETGLVTQAVQRHFNNLHDHEGYLCGSPGMIDASIKVLTNLGMAQNRIYYDKFS